MRAYEACEYLVRRIGHRWIGSSGEKRAGDWLERELGQLGYETRRLWFDCPAWDYERTTLLVDGEPVEAGAQMFSPPCDVEAELVRIEPDGKGGFAGDVAGRIAVLKEEEAPGVLKRSRLAHALKAAGALAAIIVSRLPDTWSTKLFRDPGAGLPCAAVSGRDGERLLEKPGARATLVIDAQPRPGTTSVVIAERVPVDAPVLIVGAHYDAAPYCPGASDNAAGVGVLLELADRLSSTELRTGLRFCAFGGHEFGGSDLNGFGSKNYVRTGPEELRSVRLVLNLDGIGVIDTHPALAVYGDEALWERVREFASAREGVDVRRASGGGADVGAFRNADIECVWLCASGSSERADRVYHSPLDDMRWIDESAMTRFTQTAFEFVSEVGMNL